MDRDGGAQGGFDFPRGSTWINQFGESMGNLGCRIWLGSLQQLQDICRIEILSHILGLTTMGTQAAVSITVVQMTRKKRVFQVEAIKVDTT